MICSVPDDFKVSPGAVEAVAVHPTNSDKVSTLVFELPGKLIFETKYGKNSV